MEFFMSRLVVNESLSPTGAFHVAWELEAKAETAGPGTASSGLSCEQGSLTEGGSFLVGQMAKDSLALLGGVTWY